MLGVREHIEQGRQRVVEALKKRVRFDEKNLLNNLPYVLLVCMLGIVHVASNHAAEDKIRSLQQGEEELRELRWTYMTQKARLMQASRQSEVAKTVEHLDLKALDVPPQKIVKTEK